MTDPTPTPSLCHYFVDEAGDPALFNRRKQVIVGRDGCSSYFILGVLQAFDPRKLNADLAGLRGDMLADPFFKRVPSMQPAAGKTALFFHAKDDVPEVRRKVFKLLAGHSLRFVVVRDKACLVNEVRQRNLRSATYRYNPNELYDAMVRRLFKDRLHKDDQYAVCFAKRGRSDRTKALCSALESARRNFRRTHNIEATAPVEVTACASHQVGGLQAADYFLWALQRLYESAEERYVEYLWPQFGLVHDVDDRRTAAYGVYYSQSNPLTTKGIKKEPGI